MASFDVRPSEPFPLGAHYDGNGTRFSVFSEVATDVSVCLFDEQGAETRVPLPDVTAFCWNGYVRGVKPGQRYGFRVEGPWSPADGQRCNMNKLLLDPYARAISGSIQWGPAVLPYVMGQPDQRDDQDNAPFVPRSIVVDSAFEWGNDRPLRRPLPDSVIYELHVKGFTKRLKDVPDAIRGTYAGLAHPAAVERLERLGVTAVELMPVHHFLHDGFLIDRGLRNYWGYNSIGYFAPHAEYASGGDAGEQVNEFKQMVKALHGAGIEVILDVVYNHTAEGNQLGPAVSFKGLDNTAYYRTSDNDKRYYMDYTGTGNTLNMRHPQTLQLVMDSLRYWVIEMHVDGFRFDLAATLARELYDVDRLSAFFDIIQQDPILNRVKLIAEPWDVGNGGYQVGNFPVLWCEWNGKYRDTTRDYWRSQPSTLGEFARRLTGSSDLYQDDGRRPYASINFVTAHDGFTLRDLVSYDGKHNEANGEHNNDGGNDNRSWNLGAEGPTDNVSINAARARQQRNFLATLMLSQGVPMLLGGDEMGRTQQGNNNAYCQDNEISWLDWGSADEGLIEFTRQLIAFRREHHVFRRRRWFRGRTRQEGVLPDIAWFRCDGNEMTEQDWTEWFAKSFIVFLNGETVRRSDRAPIHRDDTFCLLFNAHTDTVRFTLPPERWGHSWTNAIDTARDDPFAASDPLTPGAAFDRMALSLQVLILVS